MHFPPLTLTAWTADTHFFCISSRQVAATDFRRENSNPLLHHPHGRFLESFISDPRFCLRMRELRMQTPFSIQRPTVKMLMQERRCRLKHKRTVLPPSITYLKRSFKGGEVQLWKPGEKSNKFFQRPLRRNSALLSHSPSCPLCHLPGPIQNLLSAEGQSLCEQTRGRCARVCFCTQQCLCVCPQWPLPGTYSAYFSGLRLINSITFSDEISTSRANISDRH